MFTEREKSFIEDAKDLTNCVRNDADWEELRNILIEKGFDLQNLLLICFMEDEELNEYGVFITIDNKKVFEYERQVGDGIAGFNLKDITNDSDRQKAYPQIPTGLKIIDAGILE